MKNKLIRSVAVMLFIALFSVVFSGGAHAAIEVDQEAAMQILWWRFH